MQIQIQDAFKTEADTVIQRLRTELGSKNIPFTDMTRNDPATIAEAESIEINIAGISATQAGDFRTVVQDLFPQWNLISVNSSDFKLTLRPTDAQILKQDTMTQAMGTIQRKIDGLGLAEASVQQRGGADSEAEVLVQLPGVEDPARIKAMLQQVGKLELLEVQGGPFASRQDALSSKNGILGWDRGSWRNARAAAEVRRFTSFRARRKLQARTCATPRPARIPPMEAGKPTSC